MKQTRSIKTYIRFWESAAYLFAALFIGTLVAVKISFGSRFYDFVEVLAFGGFILFGMIAAGFVLMFVGMLTNKLLGKKFNLDFIRKEIDRTEKLGEDEDLKDYIGNLYKKEPNP